MSQKYSQLQNCACAALRQSSRLITQLYEDAFKAESITAAQFNVLGVLANTGPIPVSQLATVMVQDRTGLTRNLKVMEKNGWIIFQPGSDRRVKQVVPTKEGLTKLDNTIPLWEEIQAEAAKQLGDLSALQAQLETLKKLTET